MKRLQAGILILSLLLACCCLLPASVLASRNPFLPTDRQHDQGTTTDISPAAPGMMPNALLQTIVGWQIRLRTSMTALAKDIQTTPMGRSFWLFMLAAMAYGAAHALGPGHGKAFAVAFFLERPSSPALGLLFGNLSMLCHVLAAAILVFAGKYLVEKTASGLVNDTGFLLEGISYALLGVIGLVMVAKRIFSRFSSNEKNSRTTSGSGRKDLLFTALAAGMVPCPGASLVLLFCISLGIPATGLAALGSISLGMGTTISAVSLLTIYSRSLISRAPKSQSKAAHVLQSVLPYVGGSCMAGLGILLFTGWWFSR